MALLVKIIAKPNELMAAIKKGIDDGDVKTWRYETDKKGEKFTHCPPQFDGVAWFRVEIRDPGEVSKTEVVFSIESGTKEPVTQGIYAVFHGRLMEMLVGHFDKYFRIASVTNCTFTSY
jgi:hypothetical protein